MISRLRGLVADVESDRLTLDVNGVGYEVLLPERSLAVLRPDQPVTLFVYTAVREDAITLYGFQSLSEKRAFEQLIGVSQIGPRTGLAILSALTVEALAQAINGNDLRTLSGVPGIGKKTAERLVLELRGKLSAVAAAAIIAPDDPLPLALGRLGYKPSEVDTAILKLQERGMGSAALQARLAEALRILSGGGG
jgi:Holliday junction DNA helicase RuvA